ncbi:MAG: hypothetical protein HY858_11040 [Candidatus Solibacter usitatus]|nr:hypothetical protein [Candidatus Solibacter usitatus]
MEHEAPWMNGMTELEPVDDPGLDRRDLFRGAGTIAAWLAAANAQAAPADPPDGRVPEAKAGPLLPTVPFGKYKLTRLIAGANTIYGYSHFNYLFSAHMGEYHTTARVIAFLKELEHAGLNTWQASWSERLETDWLQYKEQGGKLQLLVLSRPDFNNTPEILPRVAKLKPMGIAQHGAATNRFWDMGQLDKSLDYLKRIRDLGVMAGFSCHNPLEVEYAEEKGWDIDYFMTSLYYMNRPRKEFEKILGQVPLGEIYLPSDPPRMMTTIRKATKPCLTYKVLAAGRSVNSPKEVKERMTVALNGIKPTDPVIIGLYQRFNDQIGQTAQFVREIAGAPAG